MKRLRNETARRHYRYISFVYYYNIVFLGLRYYLKITKLYIRTTIIVRELL